ncbi:hypothetical protein C5167_025124 [Papaver somniferum]|uniref:Uncharacterized protein n=1 Tax=Papaver somniferum TaxID=3469 RepID=A0A4Y7JUG9_PAPSO|nr:hypothetical protein C5167_025124 [Papaver somniferum]
MGVFLSHEKEEECAGKKMNIAWEIFHDLQFYLGFCTVPDAAES